MSDTLYVAAKSDTVQSAVPNGTYGTQCGRLDRPAGSLCGDVPNVPNTHLIGD